MHISVEGPDEYMVDAQRVHPGRSFHRCADKGRRVIRAQNMCGVRVEGQDNAFDAASGCFTTRVRNQFRMAPMHAVEVADSYYRIAGDQGRQCTPYKRDAARVDKMPIW